METAHRVLAGIDVHKKMLAVVVRSESGDDHLTAWLQSQGVSEVVMESTAQYWRPVWYALEAHLLHLMHPAVRSDWRTGYGRARLWKVSYRARSSVAGGC
jgi:hypothetical protein